MLAALPVLSTVGMQIYANQLGVGQREDGVVVLELESDALHIASSRLGVVGQPGFVFVVLHLHVLGAPNTSWKVSMVL